MTSLYNLDTDSLQDTPTIGAGFWAEQWVDENPFDRSRGMVYQQPTLSPAARLVNGDFSSVIQECLPGVSSYLPLSFREYPTSEHPIMPSSAPHGVALSGTGNNTPYITYPTPWLTSSR
jgi:L-asparaginase